MKKYCPGCYTEYETEDTICPQCATKLEDPLTDEEAEQMLEFLMKEIRA